MRRRPGVRSRVVRLRLLAIPLLLVAAVPAGAPAAPPGPPPALPGTADAGRFRDVLAVGQGGSTSAFDLGGFLAGGGVPASFENQREMYTGIVRAVPGLGEQDLDRWFKDASFHAFPDGVARTDTPRDGVTILRDGRFGVPRVYGATRADVMFGSGYAQAQDRLFMMDVLRHYGRAELTNFVGASSGLKNDVSQFAAVDYTEAELEAQVEGAVRRAGVEGQEIRADLQAYADGVNAWIAETQADPSKLPAEYPAIGRRPEPWKLTDSVAAATLIGGQFGKGGGYEAKLARLLAELEQRFGRRGARGVFSDLVRAEDPEAPVTIPGRFRFSDPARPNARGVARLDRGSLKPANPVASDTGAGGSASRAGAPVIAVPSLARGQASNAVLIDAAHSANGRALAVMGPQVGYYSPEILMNIGLHGAGIDVHGVAFPGLSPYVLLGHGRDFAWSATTPVTDNVDEFAERLCEPGGKRPTRSSAHYLYRGKCVPFEVRERVLTDGPTPTSPSRPSREIRLRQLRSVHGPVQWTATVGGRPVAIAEARSTYRREIDSVVAFERLNLHRFRGPRGFQRATAEVEFTFNWYYVDARSIAHLQSGRYPVRARGTDPFLPTWGTGTFDWRGYLPFSRLVKAVNPRGGAIVNWNNKIARGWRAPDDWQYFSSVHRQELLDDPLRALLARRKVAPSDVVRIVQRAATQDLRGVEVLPVLLAVVGRPADPVEADAVRRLRAWHAAGAHRRDLDGDNVYEHSDGVALMDAWWDRLVDAMFRPVLGARALDAARQLPKNPDLAYAARPDLPLETNGSAFGIGWWGYVDKDLRRVLGRRVRGPLSREYCGRGSLARCRQILRRTLRAAVAAAAARGGGTLDDVRIPATCEVATPKRCDQIEPQTTGAIATPPFPWQNRPTYQQVVDFPPGG
jgi:acyl-homoserine lactone acylase PvdQ